MICKFYLTYVKLDTPQRQDFDFDAYNKRLEKIRIAKKHLFVVFHSSTGWLEMDECHE